jgi:protein disulfide-isomerase
VGAAIEKNYVPVKVNAISSSAMAYAFKVDRVPSDVILTSHGNILATYTSPLTQQDYLAKLSEVVTQFGRQGSKPVAVAGPRQVNAAYAGLQGSRMQAASTPVGIPVNPVAQQASASNATPATSALATAALNPPPASQPSQSVDRYALPIRQNSSPQKPEVPANAMPSSYRNPYMAPQMQSSAVTRTGAPAAYPSQRPATTNTVPPAVTSNTVNGAVAATMTKAKIPKTSSTISQLPAGSPPLGFEGYCPVTLKFDKKWVRGNVQYGAIHRGRTYLFVGDGQRQQFLANPDAYSPVFSGMDPVALLDNKQTVEGSRKYGFEYRGAFYLFSNSETMQKFASQPDRYAAGVRQAMVQHDGGSGVIRR